jgi:hypothetical protein
VIFGRKRFGEVVARQLGFFVEDDSALLQDVADALEAYNRADKDDAEELYGDYQLMIEAATDRLAELRDAYANTLDDPEQYEREFNAEVVRRWPSLSLTIEES